MLYNRASADPQGRPWSERKKYVWWDEEQGKWTGYDVPDFPADKRPDYEAPDDAEGMDAISGDDPFIMMGDGRAWLYSPSGLLDGPMPTHYEPFESPVDNALYPEVGANPAALRWDRDDNPYRPAAATRAIPYVASTFRLTEHHTAGAMSRNLPWLAELQPEMFAELDPDARGRARDRGRRLDDDRDRARRDRGAGEGDAPACGRCRSTAARSTRSRCRGTGATTARHRRHANDLVSLSGDPNVTIQRPRRSPARSARRRSERDDRARARLRGGAGAAPTRDHAAEPDRAGREHEGR